MDPAMQDNADVRADQENEGKINIPALVRPNNVNMQSIRSNYIANMFKAQQHNMPQPRDLIVEQPYRSVDVQNDEVLGQYRDLYVPALQKLFFQEPPEIKFGQRFHGSVPEGITVRSRILDILQRDYSNIEKSSHFGRH